MDEPAQANSNKKTARQILKDYYGFDAFRAHQEEIVQDLINGQDLLVLMPTGGGKSLCYQIPAMIRNGVGIVVSPLIALMEDQVVNLRQLGIRAAFYNSSLSSDEARQVLRSLHNQTLDLLYIAPERLLSDGFLQRLSECSISLFAIDEAHCISQWGHDFRKEYASLGRLKNHFKDVPIIALTATADVQTRQDIVKQLEYQPKEYITSFNRPNIHYHVAYKNNPFKQVTDYLSTQNQQAGIIYCRTRANVETLTEKLKLIGHQARAYHAGLSHQERSKVQSLFRHDHIDIVVATIAFGMGIDKPNVRFVIHYDLPKTIESYYQETGRAGRDGLPANALLLYDPADSGRLRAWINDMEDNHQQRIEHHKLNHMLAFAEATHCRRQILLRYFNETQNEPCNYCDICDSPPKIVDSTEDVQKMLSCIYRLKQNYGMVHVIDVLRGSQSEKIAGFGHDKLTTFSIGKDKPASYWKQLAWQLIHREYCYQDINHFNVLRLSAKAIPILKGEEQIALAIAKTQVTKEKPLKQKGRAVKIKSTESNNPLFEALRQLRRQLANEENKPPFMIFSDMTLHEMVEKMPRTLQQLLDVSGVGQHKLEHYGQFFLDVLQEQHVLMAEK
jgi:ATP-dependent DNA helicase RecQ